jgi:DNA-binding transcriptional ArsR family regulator
MALAGELGISQSALSQHLALMREEGIVACRREGPSRHYRVSDAFVGAILGSLRSHYCQA